MRWMETYMKMCLWCFFVGGSFYEEERVLSAGRFGEKKKTLALVSLSRFIGWWGVLFVEAS